MEKRYTVKATGTDATTGKKTWGLYDKKVEKFLPQYEGGRFLLQGMAAEMNEGKLGATTTPVKEADPHTAPTKGRLIGYMRVSTDKETQKFDRQETQLKDVGVEMIYSDRMSGSKRDRPSLNEMLDSLQADDIVYIVEIARLSRSTKDLIDIVDIIKAKGASLKSINDTWLDTSSANPMSEFLLTVMGALGQMERAMITQRVKEGVEVAKRKGVKMGRPTANKTKVSHALELYDAGEHTVKQIVDITGISKATLFRKLKAREESEANG